MSKTGKIASVLFVVALTAFWTTGCRSGGNPAPFSQPVSGGSGTVNAPQSYGGGSGTSNAPSYSAPSSYGGGGGSGTTYSGGGGSGGR